MFSLSHMHGIHPSTVQPKAVDRQYHSAITIMYLLSESVSSKAKKNIGRRAGRSN